MSKTKYFTILGALFSGLLLLAVWKDCNNLVQSAKDQLSEVDSEALKHEQKFIDNLKTLSNSNVTNLDAFREYNNAGSIFERRQAFKKLSLSLNSFQTDSTNIVTRRIIDEMNGALNRISRLDQSYTKAEENYLDTCKSWQGKLVGCSKENLK